MSHTYAIFGDDARQSWLFSLLEKHGFHAVQTIDPAVSADTIVLPIPSVTKDGMLAGTDISFPDYLRALPPDTVIWGTGFSRFSESAQQAGLTLNDFTAYEQFTSDNALPTAEGALQLAMEELPTTIHGSRFLVIGYGRIGKQLARLLNVLGGSVTVARQQGDAPPFRTDTTGDYRYPLQEYDAIFNTVPAPVFGKEQCARTRSDCLLIDLASHPGGIAKTADRKLIHALGLPAKTSPKTAAEIMLRILVKEEETWSS